MAEPPELWTFLAFNLLVLVFGGILAAVSYVTYRRKGSSHFGYAALGFSFVTLGGVTELLYQVGWKQSYLLGGRELLAVQSVEALLMGIGLGLLFYSIYTFSPQQQTLTDWEESAETSSDTEWPP
jgi:TRAP-type C4-dicarboxylate transport system permease small subunit